MTLRLALFYRLRMLSLSIVGWLVPVLPPFHSPLLKTGMNATLSTKQKTI